MHTSASHVAVASLGEMPVDVQITGLEAPRGEAEMSSHVTCALEAFPIFNACLVSQSSCWEQGIYEPARLLMLLTDLSLSR
jgi:hypothetical protein